MPTISLILVYPVKSIQGRIFLERGSLLSRLFSYCLNHLCVLFWYIYIYIYIGCSTFLSRLLLLTLWWLSKAWTSMTSSISYWFSIIKGGPLRTHSFCKVSAAYAYWSRVWRKFWTEGKDGDKGRPLLTVILQPLCLVLILLLQSSYVDHLMHASKLSINLLITNRIQQNK